MSAQSIWCAHCYDEGWLWDSTDSGSGAQVYCDCVHGARLREHDLFECNETPPPPSPTPTKEK